MIASTCDGLVGRTLYKMALAEFDEALISVVQKYPCLYDNKSPDFKVVWKKENAWVEISKQLKSDGIDTS